MDEKRIIARMLKEGKINEEEAFELYKAIYQSYGQDIEELKKPDFLKGTVQQETEKSSVSGTEDEIEEPVKDSVSDNVLKILGGIFAKQRITDEKKGSFNSSEPDIVFNSTNGNIDLIGWKKDEYRMIITYYVQANSREEALQMIEQAVNINQQDNGLSFTVAGPKRFLSKITASIKLYLPQNLVYNFDLAGTNGNLHTYRVGMGNISIKLTNGNIKLREISSRQMLVKAHNGNINIAGAGEIMRISITNGNITVNTETAEMADIELTTTNGNGRIYLPPGEGYYLEGKSSIGNVKFDLENLEYIKQKQKILKKHFVARSTNWDTAARKYKVTASTVNGNIKIKKAAN